MTGGVLRTAHLEVSPRITRDQSLPVRKVMITVICRSQSNQNHGPSQIKLNLAPGLLPEGQDLEKRTENIGNTTLDVKEEGDIPALRTQQTMQKTVPCT